MPFRWVTAADIEGWADRIGARTDLANLVGDLIRATVSNVRAFRFPGGDAGETPGFDGLLESAVAAPPNVPEGVSVWEFGAGANPEQKAARDYKSRTDEPLQVDPSNTTFVFVTPRRWPKAGDWAADRRREGPWVNVRALDSVDLEEWLLRAPSVAAAFASHTLGKAPDADAVSGDDFWEEQAVRTRPRLTEALVLAGREDASEKLRQALLGEDQQVIIRADSPDEALTFALAAIRSGTEKEQEFLLSRTIVVSSERAARGLKEYERLIVAVRGEAVPLAASLREKRHHVIVPLGNDAMSQSVTLNLARPPGHAFAKALEAMGLPNEDAQKLARECGRSVTILQRRRPSAGAAAVPAWANAQGARALLPALLAGSWSSASDGDRAALMAISGLASYDEFERQLVPFLSVADRPVERAGALWQPVAPVDGLTLLGRFATPPDLRAFATAVQTVLSEADPILALPPEEREFAAMRAERMVHSEVLRTGLANSMVLIAAQGDECGLPCEGGAQQFINGIVAKLFANAPDVLMTSLSRQLPALAEAAPLPFFDALRRLLKGDGEGAKKFFAESGMLGPSSPHTGLLWALEGLAWSPDHLMDAALLLAHLASIDPGGKLVNRPINSLTEILLSWHPGTAAALPERLRVLDRVLEAEPEVGWNLLLALAPEAHSVSHHTHRPRWREDGAVERQNLTWADVFAADKAHVSRLIQCVAAKPSAGRWFSLLEAMPRFDAEQRNQARALLEQFARDAGEEERFAVWGRLQKVLNKHRQFQDAAWALEVPELDIWSETLARLAPSDQVKRSAWLFESSWVDLPDVPHENQREELIRRQRGAVAELLGKEGLAGVLRLADAVKEPRLVGAALVLVVHDPSLIGDFLRELLPDLEPRRALVMGTLFEAARAFGEEWKAALLLRAQHEAWPATVVASVMQAWPDGRDTWMSVEKLGDEVKRHYWLQRYPWAAQREEHEDAIYCATRYLEVGRAAAAMISVNTFKARIESELLIHILDEVAVRGAKDGGPMDQLDAHLIQELFDELASRKDVPRLAIARREYAFLPIFGYDKKQRVVHELLAAEPKLYVEVLCDTYRAATASDAAESVRPDDERTEQEKRLRAERGWKLLRSLTTIPGQDEMGGVDASRLLAWIREVRELATAADRSEVSDLQIGRLLAYAPIDPVDAAWPHRAVRDALEAIQSDRVEDGIAAEQFNKRGVYGKEIFEGGKQERGLAARAEAWAQAAADWPRTRSLLRRIAETWLAEGRREDIRAEQQKMAFH